MRHLFAVGLVLVAALGAAGCASSGNHKVRTDFDPDVDFTRYVTYDWLDSPLTSQPIQSTSAAATHPFEGNTLVDKRVRRAVDSELAARGYQRAGDTSPDFRVRYQVSFEHDTDDSDATHRPDRFEQGLLFIDVIDAESQRMSWRGWTRDRNRDGYFTDEQLRRSVTSILSKFPPQGVEPPGEEQLLRRRVSQLEEQLRLQEARQKELETAPAAPAATEAAETPGATSPAAPPASPAPAEAPGPSQPVSEEWTN
jgi:hypothetical protein